MASQEIEALSSALARLPGLGPRSARRAVLWLVKHRETALPALLEALAGVSETLVECQTCGNVDTANPCGICTDPRRDGRALCVVEEVSDVWALDRARLFPGLYHVLGGRLSALDGIGPENLNIASLLGRVEGGAVDEVVLAMNATLEGQTTAHYIRCASRSSPMDCRSAASSTISTKARWPKPCERGGPSVKLR
jgi:recombination protein RecR